MNHLLQGRGGVYSGAGVPVQKLQELSVLSTQFCCTLKAAQKRQNLLIEKRKELVGSLSAGVLHGRLTIFILIVVSVDKLDDP